MAKLDFEQALIKKLLIVLAALITLAAIVYFAFEQTTPKQSDVEYKYVGVSNVPRDQRGGVIYGPGNAYQLVAPDGWVIDTEAGKEAGYKAVFYEYRGNWEDPIAVYTVGRNKSGHSIEEFIKDNIAWYQNEFPGMQVSEWKSIQTSDGNTAHIRFFEGAEGVAKEVVAYIDAPHDVNMVVLVVEDDRFFTQGFAAYQEIVKSYKFITSDIEVIKKEVKD